MRYAALAFGIMWVLVGLYLLADEWRHSYHPERDGRIEVILGSALVAGVGGMLSYVGLEQ